MSEGATGCRSLNAIFLVSHNESVSREIASDESRLQATREKITQIAVCPAVSHHCWWDAP
jgi:hypothetical protein